MILNLITPTRLLWANYNAILATEFVGIPIVAESKWRDAATEVYSKLNSCPSPQKYATWQEWASVLSAGVR